MTTKQRVAVGAGVGLLVLGAGMVTVTVWGRRTEAAAADPASGLTASLTVEPFHTGDPAPRSWTSAAFAESLAARLSRTPGLRARTDGREADFTLRGNVTTRDERLVIATRLYRSGQEAPVWTATLWRHQDAGLGLVDDLAADVSEALYAHLARDAVRADRRTP